MADLQARFGVGRIALVADRGLISEENLALVAANGFDHVLATRLHRDPTVAAVLKLPPVNRPSSCPSETTGPKRPRSSMSHVAMSWSTLPAAMCETTPGAKRAARQRLARHAQSTGRRPVRPSADGQGPFGNVRKHGTSSRVRNARRDGLPEKPPCAQ